MTDDMIARVALAAFVLAVALRCWLAARALPQTHVVDPTPLRYDDEGTRIISDSVGARRSPHRARRPRPCQCRSATCQPRTGRWLVRAAGVA
ncbi:hypothetical protein [Catellatospora tritici]|uniref:hypothetical protein n=1 Tax=Catellatospora tritici TaxID=2851566 RepID=UPI001C2D9766|nr:hypothetical protein [Catellatospora tritici]MBV1855907.1 hypothetical protein [Catellatospora tritici]